MPETVTTSHPIIENIRLQVAATEALAELESEGILVGAQRLQSWKERAEEVASTLPPLASSLRMSNSLSGSLLGLPHAR